jgi:very-short-patch-repair endonuclease
MGVIRDRHARLVRHRAKRLRLEPTRTERELWECLRDRRLGGWKWRRQGVVGPFIVDFICLEAALAIELDGEHHSQQQVYDARRDAFLRAKGLRVLRFRNSDFLDNPSAVTNAILRACELAPLLVQRVPSPRAAARGEGQG